MASTINTVGYALYENRLKREDGKGKTWYARVLSRGRMTEADLVEFITGRNSTVTRTEVIAVLDLLDEAVKTGIRMGFSVSTRTCTAFLSMQGTFDSMTDSFDPERHNLVLNIAPSKSLTTCVERMRSFEKAETVPPAPVLHGIRDYASNERSGRVTPGNTAELDGVNLRIDPRSAEQGVYFTTDTDPAGIRADSIISICRKKIVFQVPALPRGESYTLEVRCGFGSILRTAKLAVSVIAAEPAAV